jgi:hypothetical protein
MSKQTRVRYKRTCIITLLVSENPKRSNSAAWDRFALYRTGMTIAEYVASGGRPGDINYDVKHGLISVQE